MSRITKAQIKLLCESLLTKADEYKQESVDLHKSGRRVDGYWRDAQSSGMRMAVIEIQNTLLAIREEGK